VPSYTQQAVAEVLPDGSEWEFEITNAQEKESQAGNQLIELCLRILNGAGKGQLVYDNLTFTEKAYFRIDQFRVATGDKLVPGQEAILEAEDCIGRHGRVVLKIDNYQGRARNKVDFYVTDQVRSTKTATTPVGKNELGEPGDVPF
jgi:hypothetical protein